MKDIDQVIEEVFAIIKTEKSVLYSELYKIEGAKIETVELAWNILTKNYKLILCSKQIFTLSKEGKIHESVSSYLKSLNKKHFTTYQKVYLILMSVFGLFGVGYSIYTSYSESNHKILEENYNSLKSQYDDAVLRCDSLEVERNQLRKQMLSDTLQTKN